MPAQSIQHRRSDEVSSITKDETYKQLMVRAFAGLLNREADGSYWLVVPYQKLSIEVEDA